MNCQVKPIPYLFISLILGAVLAFNLFAYRSLYLGLAIGIIYLLFYGLVFGSLLFGKNSLGFKIFYGSFSLISLLSLSGAVIYYLLNLNLAIIATLLLALPWIFFAWLFRKNGWHNLSWQMVRAKPEKKNPLMLYLLVVIFLGLTVWNFYLLIQAGTINTLQSPWLRLDNLFFLTFLLGLAVLIAIVLTNNNHRLSLVLIAIQSFLALSVALIIYQIGYGFDSFIHQATEKTIAAYGYITPKPFYYIGQYSLVVILSKLISLPVEIIDRLLVPLLASLFLPATIYVALNRGFNWAKKYCLLIALLFLTLPFSYFIVTTPQGLANVYFLIIIFLSLLYVSRPAKLSVIFFLAFLSLTALLIHPLTGIPLLIFLALLTFYSYIKHSEKITALVKKSLFWEIFIVAAVALPLVFIINSSLTSSGLNASFNSDLFLKPENLLTAIHFNWPDFQRLFHPVYDYIYGYGYYLNYAIVLLAIIGWLLAKKNHEAKLFGVYLATFLVLAINAWLLKTFISFPSLIYYEQGDYPQRVWQLSLYFLLPFLFYAVYWLIKTAKEKKIFSLQLGLVFFITIFTGASLYLSYPRHDYYLVGHGYSVSASDLKTVQYIDNDAQGEDYVVLANQTVAAAAVKELGFKKYYQNEKGEEIYFYPIPTGGSLYQIYLKMVYDEPYRETALEAKKLTGANSVYFVLNSYWTSAQDIAEIAQETADKWAVIDGGKTYIFKYNFR